MQDEECYLEAGKVIKLLELLEQYGKQKRKVLVFSQVCLDHRNVVEFLMNQMRQFTQVLDVLQAILKKKGIDYLVLTGSTPVDARQALVDEFTDDDSIPVFLLSTKAGGMGINLTAASVVVM